MSNVADILASLKTLQAKGPTPTYAQIAPLQAALDAADAARYVPGADVADSVIADIDEAYEILGDLMEHAADVDARLLEPIHRLLDASAAADRLLAKAKHHTSGELLPIQAVLDDVQLHLVDGIYYGTPSDVPAGQAYLSEVVARLADKVEALNASVGDTEMNEATGAVFHALSAHHAHLASLARKPMAVLKSSECAKELSRIQGQLQKLEADRKSSLTGAWGVGPDGAVPPGQAACADLLERSFRLAHKCLVRVEKAESAGLVPEK